MAKYWIAVSMLIAACLLTGVTTRPAEDDLRNTVQYFPFYGGAKGQYLEVTKDRSGTVIKEKIVQEENITSEDIVKNRDENLISRVLSVNLQNIQSISTNLLKLHNLGRKTGYLRRSDKILFKEQMSNLGETASNLIKLIDEIGDDVDMLFKKNATQRQSYYEDDVGEEGVGIDSPPNIEELGEVLSGATIADAKPVGLAVIGENGLAAARPMATAVAATGVAIARPVATAIAGINPAILGLNIQGHGSKKL